MSLQRADKIIHRIFELTASGEYEDRENIMSLVRQFSDREDILDRLDRFEKDDLYEFIKSLLKVIPLSSEREFEDILNGDHVDFPWLPKAKYFKPIDALRKSLLDVKSLVAGDSSNQIIRLCYIQVITTTEAFLGDSLKEKVLTNKSSIERLLQNEKELCKEKISLHKAYVNSNYPRSRVEEYLASLLYHNFEKVINIYKIALCVDISFPSVDCKNVLLKARDIRHDLIHRNGFDKNGKKIRVATSDLDVLVNNIEIWVGKIESIGVV